MATNVAARDGDKLAFSEFRPIVCASIFTTIGKIAKHETTPRPPMDPLHLAKIS